MAAAASCSAAAIQDSAPFQMTQSFKRNSKRAHNIITTAVITGGPSTTTSTHLAPPSLAKGMSRSPSGSGKSVTFITEEVGNNKYRNNNKEQQQQQPPNNFRTISSTPGNGCSNSATNNGDLIPMTTLGDNVINKPGTAATTHQSSTTSIGIAESPLGIIAGNDSRQIEPQK